MQTISPESKYDVSPEPKVDISPEPKDNGGKPA